MTNHPNRSNSYVIEATVKRAAGTSKTIEWEWSGKGCGTSCWSAWRRMKESNATCDTQEPIVSAALYRNGSVVERIGNVVSI